MSSVDDESRIVGSLDICLEMITFPCDRFKSLCPEINGQWEHERFLISLNETKMAAAIRWELE